jgi:predicted peptidase
MGGYGCWHLAEALPRAFAAVVPICGTFMADVGFPGRVRALSNVPVWAFHGALDDAVPVKEMRELVRVLRKAGGQVRLTVYRDVGHDSWTPTYDNPRLYEWLAQQRNDRFSLP